MCYVLFEKTKERKNMSDLRWEHYAEQKKEQILDEIYEKMPELYQFDNYKYFMDNLIRYVNCYYDDWERFISKEDLEELYKEYTASLT
jgi:hypothetical protein